jgi:dienelactone hydrolase
VDVELGPPCEALERTSPRLDRRRDEVRRRRVGASAGEEAGQQKRGRQACAALACAISLSVSACALLPHSGERVPEIERREYTLAGGFLHVEVSIPQEPAGRKPAVIGALGLEERLLELGIAVVRFHSDWGRLGRLSAAARAREGAPEPNRVGTWMLAAPRPGIVGRGYFAVIGATARSSIPLVFEQVASLPEIDPTRIGIAGSSTHGFVALEALREEPRLAAGVVRVACGDYHRFLRSSSLALNDDPRWLPGGELVLDEGYEAGLREREPLRFADHYPPRPLLMLNGASDPAIPLACAESTASALERAYHEAGAPERFRFLVYPDAGHDLGPDAERVVIDWWERWLLGRDSADRSRLP